MKTVIYSLSNREFSEKPGDEVIAQISNDLTRGSVESSLDVLVEHQITHGRTVSPAIFGPDKDGKVWRRNVCWKEQQLFFLDIDGNLPYDVAIERCRRYEILPVLCYATFSSDESNNKYRMVFCLPAPTCSIEVRGVVQTALMYMFPERDSNCKDPARFFYGGKRTLHRDFDVNLDIVNLVSSVCAYIKEAHGSNASRKVKEFCGATGLHMQNGSPVVIYRCNYMEVDDESRCTPIIYYRTSPDLVNTSEDIIFIFESDIANKIFDSEDGNIRVEVTNDKIDNSTYLAERFDWGALASNCKLYGELLHGAGYKHGVRFGVATNFLNIKGGQSKFFELIDHNHLKWEGDWKYLGNLNYKPADCKNFCPHQSKCGQDKNMIRQARLQRGEVQVIDRPPLIPLRIAEEALRNAFERASDGITVIKASTAILRKV